MRRIFTHQVSNRDITKSQQRNTKHAQGLGRVIYGIAYLGGYKNVLREIVSLRLKGR
jgi:hypothetical protein